MAELLGRWLDEFSPLLTHHGICQAGAPVPKAKVHKDGGPHVATTNTSFAKFAVLHSALFYKKKNCIGISTIYMIQMYYSKTTVAIIKSNKMDCADL